MSQMAQIQDYIEIIQLGVKKDYPALEAGDGYVVPAEDFPTAALHPKSAVQFLALLRFAHNVPRGNHYHLHKIEHIVLLKGQLRCDFALKDDPKTVMAIVLEAGQMVRILPGCIHTYTALGGDAFALEYSPQRYEAADVMVVA